MSKLLYIVHSLNVGGTEILVANLAKHFSGKYEVAILALDSIGKIGEELAQTGIPIYTINRVPGWKLRNFLEFFKIIKSFKPEIVHAHQYTPFFFAAICKLCRVSFAKLIFTEHGRHFPDVVSRKRQIVNQLLWKQTEAVTAVCDFSALALKDKEKYSGEISVIYNGIKTPEVGDPINLYQQLELPVDSQLIVYLGTFRAVKNPILLMEAMNLVVKSNPKVYAFFIGDGEQKSKLQELIAKYSLSHNVCLLGELRDVGRYWSNFSFIVQPSLSEAHSLALLEAMSQGLPAIVTNVGGAPEVITNNHNGFLVDSGNIQELAEKIILLAGNIELQTKLGNQAKQDFQNKFTAETMIKNYQSLYSRILNNK